MSEQRKVVAVTPLGKIYRGMVDVPNDNFRTTDLFNSSSIYWRDSAEKCFENTVLFHDVELDIGDSAICVKFDKIQIKLSEIIYFYDDHENITDEQEKIRASTMIQKTQEQSQKVDIISKPVSNSFYHLTGVFFGLFKKKSNDRFIPLTDAKLVEVYKKVDKWYQRELDLPYKFIGVSTHYIEALRLM